MAVRLTAASALRICISVSVTVLANVDKNELICLCQTPDFDLTSFEPFISAVVPQLLNLVSELDTLEGKRRVLGCLRAVVEGSRTRVRLCELCRFAEES